MWQEQRPLYDIEYLDALAYNSVFTYESLRGAKWHDDYTRGVRETRPAGRSAIVIEGKDEYVRRLSAAMADTLQEISKELAKGAAT